MYDFQHCVICHPSDSTVSENAGIEPRTVASLALKTRRSNHSARSHFISSRPFLKVSRNLFLPAQLGCYYTLQRQFSLYIPFLGIARPQSQFPHSCVCERFIYSQDRSTYFLQQKRQTRMYIIRSQTHECGNWDWGPEIPFLWIFVSNYRHFVFAV